MNKELLNAFQEQDMETIIEELKPLFFKHMTGVSANNREDIFQELVLSCLQVVVKYDFSEQHKLF